MTFTELPPFIDTEDTPVWMLFRNAETGNYRPVLVAWYNFDFYDERGFLTLKSFGTKAEAETYLQDFWDSYWRLMTK